MRSLLFLVVLILALIGPYHYFTAGRAARAEHRQHLVEVRRAATEVRGLLSSNVPPAVLQLEANRQRLDNVRRLIDRFHDGVQRPGNATTPTDTELLELARLAAVDAGVLRPVLDATAAGSEARGGRLALRALLRAMGESKDLTIESLRVSPRSSFIGTTMIQRRNIEFTAAGSPTSGVRLVERLTTGSADDPPGDVISVSLDRTNELEWLRSGWDGDAPPMRITVSIDLLLAGGDA